jgi:hypothetical protein
LAIPPRTSAAKRTTTCSIVPSQPTFDQWQIWQVRWHHTDDGTYKKRPALLLTTASFNACRPIIPFLKISSREPRSAHKLALKVSDPWFAATGLTKACFIHFAKPQWVPLAKILWYRGELILPASMDLDTRIRLATGWSPS